MVDLLYDDIEVHVDVEPRLQDKLYNNNSSEGVVVPDNGYDLLNSVQFFPLLEDKIVNVHENGSVQV